MGREAGFLPHRQRRELDEQLGGLGEVGDGDGPRVMAVAVPVVVVFWHLVMVAVVLAVIRLPVVPVGAMAGESRLLVAGTLGGQ
jgi:hypothetical protein